MSAPVRWGSVSQARWNELLVAGWKGRAGDRQEALYPPSRPLQRAVRQMADRNAAALAAIPASRIFIATVAAVTPGGASDGNALVQIRWRDSIVTANAYGSTYTPAVGHRVLCALIDNQLIVTDRLIGAP